LNHCRRQSCPPIYRDHQWFRQHLHATYRPRCRGAGLHQRLTSKNNSGRQRQYQIDRPRQRLIKVRWPAPRLVPSLENVISWSPRAKRKYFFAFSKRFYYRFLPQTSKVIIHVQNSQQKTTFVRRF
jgi:hypothetical protein